MIRINKEFKNAGWIIGEQVFQMIISLIVGCLSARYLGPSNYGLITYTASFITFVTSITTLGMDSVVVKKIIESPDKEGEYLGSCLIFRLVAALACSLSSIAVVVMLNPNDRLLLILISIQSVQLFFRAISILDTWFQRYLKAKYVSIAKIIACTIVAIYRIYLIIANKSIIWFAFSNTLTAIVVALVVVVFYYRQKTKALSIKLSCGLEVLSESYHFIISGLMTAVYGQLDRIMLGEMISAEAVGLYSTASVICSMWIFVPLAIINSFQPKILEQKNCGEQEIYIVSLKRLYSMIIWLCVFVSVIVFIFGKFAIVFLYGTDYSGAIHALKILIWAETFSMIGSARGIWILAENNNKYVKYYLGMGALLNIILNFILIPIYDIEGAAAATLITQIFTSIIAPLFFKVTRVHTRLVFESLAYPISCLRGLK